jgi:copper chaperone CopZ
MRAQISVSGMTCGHCERAVFELAREVEGVTDARADRTDSLLEVTFDEAITDIDRIIKNINTHGGYIAKPRE